MASWPAKDPEEILDYTVDWTLRLEGGEIIVSSVWTVASGTVVIGDGSGSPAPSVDVAGLIAKFWAEGGTLDETNLITNHIVTSAGREREFTGKLKIKAK